VRPVVGIAGEDLVVRKHFGDQRVAGAALAVVAEVRAAGGSPVVLPPGTDDLHALDALVLTGGVDLGVDPQRDRNELALLGAARSVGLPTLGVCRGLQLMAVSTGGTLVEELGDSHVIHPPGSHPIDTVPGSVIAELVPDGLVGSLHHQSVATYDDRWRATAVASDGVIEALEWIDQRAWSALGVQWHPELDGTGPAVFGWLVRAALRRPAWSGQMSCGSPLLNPLTYRQTGTATVPPPRVTAS
jgi:putative glutamine amidotransferase